MTRVFTRYIWLHIAHQLHALLCECVAIPETNSFITIRSFIIKEARSRDNTMMFLVLYHDNFHGIILHTEIRGIIPCFFSSCTVTIFIANESKREMNRSDDLSLAHIAPACVINSIYASHFTLPSPYICLYIRT